MKTNIWFDFQITFNLKGKYEGINKTKRRESE